MKRWFSILFIDKTNVSIGSNTSIWCEWNINQCCWNSFETEQGLRMSKNVEIKGICHFHISSFLQRGWASDGWPQPFVQPATQRLHWIVATSQNILPAFDFTNKTWRQFFACFEIILFFLPLLNCQKIRVQQTDKYMLHFLMFYDHFLGTCRILDKFVHNYHYLLPAYSHTFHV